MKSATILVSALLLSAGCGGPKEQATDDRPCVAVELGAYSLTSDRVDSLRMQVAPAPSGAAGVRYATDILLAEWMSTKQIGVLSDAEALRNYREVTRKLLAKQGASGLAAEFAAARAEVGVRRSTTCGGES